MQRGPILIVGTTALAAIAVALAMPTVPTGAAQSPRPAPIATDADAATKPWARYAGWPTRDSSKFNTLGALASPPAPTEPRKLANPVTGDPAIGAKLAADR